MNTPPILPEIPDPADICSAMNDLVFIKYCLTHFDIDGDNKLGSHEVETVREINLADTEVVSLQGIEYFTNLERLVLDRSTIKELNLLQNTKLKEVSARDCYSLYEAQLPNGLSIVPDNEIWYQTIDNKVAHIHSSSGFGATLVANIRKGNKCVIIFNKSIASIGRNAFRDCSNIFSIILPSSVVSIDEGAFRNCSTLVSIDASKIHTISHWAFCNCKCLTRTHFSPRITNIQNYAFYGCSSLLEFNIPDSITEIGQSAFNGCTSLTNVTIPDSVTEIGENVFCGCSSLLEFNIPDSVTSIGNWAFKGCTSLKSITIPNSVSFIGLGAFQSCFNLESISFPQGLVSIASHTCYACNSLKNVYLPQDLVSIEAYAFEHCIQLEEIILPKTTKFIGKRAFYDCLYLKSINIPSGILSIEDDVFRYSHLPITGDIRYADTYALESTDKTLESYTIRDNTRFIGSSAFSHCSNIKEINLPPTVIQISGYAFYGCVGLMNITIPAEVHHIGDSAFCECSNLKSIILPEKIDCICHRAFGNCTSLNSVYCKAKTPPTAFSESKNWSWSAFSTGSELKIYVPTESVDAYKAADGWKDYADAIEPYVF